MREECNNGSWVDVRNGANRLLGKFNETAGIFEMAVKGFVTLMKIPPGVKVEFVNLETQA